MPLVAYVFRSRARREALAMVALLDQAVRTNVPLDTFFLAAENSNRGSMRQRIQFFRSMLFGGASISEALRFASPELSRRQIALVDCAQRLGRLAVALPMVLCEGRPQRAVGVRVYPWYPLGLLILTGTVFTGFAAFIAPKFDSIFSDFHAPLPQSTVWLLELADSNWLVWLMAIPFCCAVVIALILVPSISSRPRHRPRWRPLKGVIDTMAWRMPILGTMLRDQGLADVCDLLAVAIDAAQPADAALDYLAEVPANRVMRYRIKQWAAGVHNGLSLARAARAAHLPNLLPSMLASCGSGSPAPALRFLASYYRTKFSKVAALLSGAAGPLMTLAVGLLVGLVAYALFAPLVGLIDAVIKTVPLN